MNNRRLFHGSRFKVEGFLEPREARDKSVEDNCQLAVYASDRFECAAGMALTGESPALLAIDSPCLIKNNCSIEIPINIGYKI